MGSNQESYSVRHATVEDVPAILDFVSVIGLL